MSRRRMEWRRPPAWRPPLFACAAAVALAVAASAGPLADGAGALIEPPTTIEGPSSEIVDFGGAAIAPDGTGGLVYTRVTDGVPHVFASRFVGGRWGAPLRVDWDRPYDASWPRIAAGDGGRLLVVWVTQMATIGGQIRRGLVSAALRPGATGFGPSLLVDPDVRGGQGVSPSLSRAAPGQAVVAYRVVTDDFNNVQVPDVARLRPDDVAADVRVARLGSDRWSRLGTVNRNRAVSMRAPTPSNGPKIVAAPDGSSVVTWQEPSSDGTARIWARRLFGSVPGPVLPVSPATWNGRPVSDDADAFALDGTRFGLAKVALRIDGGRQSPLGGPRMLLNTLPVAVEEQAGRFRGAVLADGGVGGAVGVPSVAAADGGQEGFVRIAFAAGGAAQLVTGDDDGLRRQLPLGSGVASSAEVVTAIDPAGGGLLAWPTRDAAGRPAVGIRQDLRSGAAQAATVAARPAAEIGQLTVGRAESGDAIVAFRQGEPGRFQIVALRVSALPTRFTVTAPNGWVRPRRARVSWEPARSGVGGVRYGVVVDGRLVRDGLARRSFKPSPRVLGSGVRRVQVLATDAHGQQFLTGSLDLRVDARSPTATVVESRPKRSRRRAAARRAARSQRTVVVRVRDRHSGLRSGVTRVRFGDGSRIVRGRRTVRHAYRRPGRYTIVVHGRDRVGNRLVRRLRVQVR